MLDPQSFEYIGLVADLRLQRAQPFGVCVGLVANKEHIVDPFHIRGQNLGAERLFLWGAVTLVVPLRAEHFAKRVLGKQVTLRGVACVKLVLIFCSEVFADFPDFFLDLSVGALPSCLRLGLPHASRLWSPIATAN